jgi:tetratricopeptide (TPR) repeat protein
LELDPLLALAHSTLGSIWLQQGKLAEAEQELETAIRLGPHLAASYISLAAVHIEREELQKAETELKQALTEDVQSSSAYHNLGLVRFKQGRYDDAIKAVRKAFGIKPTREDAVVLAGLYYAKYKWLAALLAGSALLVAYTVHSLWTIAVIAIPILGMLFLAIGTLKEVDRRHGLVQLLWALFLAMLYVSGIILNW